MRIDGALAAELRFQRLRQLAPDSQPLARKATLKQIKCSVELLALEGLLLNVRRYRPVQPVNLLHQPLEARQARGIRDARTTEKYHAAFLVRLQECIWNIGTVGYELH